MRVDHRAAPAADVETRAERAGVAASSDATVIRFELLIPDLMRRRYS